MTRRRRAPAFLAPALLTLLLAALLPTVAAAATRAPSALPPVVPAAVALPGAGTPHPRILLWPEQLDAVRDRVTREPLTTLLESVRQSAESAPPPNAADQADCEKNQNENREVAKAGAARTLAFHYVLDREAVGGVVAALDPVDRAAMGDEVRDYLLTMCRKSRIKVNADRDLGTGHELLGYATAYDLLLGGGYPFSPADEAQVVDNLATLSGEFHADYQTVLGSFLTNNHGLKGAASLGIAAIVLAEYEPPGAAPDDPRWPRKWLDHAVDFSDEVFRHTYGAGDGAYGESPHYLKFAMQNVFSFARAWHRTNGGGSWTTEAGLTLPDLWTHPAFTRSARWLLDMTLPDGTLAPVDDGNGGEYAFWGAYPADFPGVGALYWRWQTQPTQDYGGSVDNRLDTLVAYDDSVVAAPPTGSATAFYEEGGSAVFRSGWDADATLAIVQGEHGAARELGRTRDGIGQEYSAPHDHSDPGSLQLHAEGEPLLVDGGYLNYPWTLQWVVNKPSDHNMVLVDPPSTDGSLESPEDTLAATTRPLWEPSTTAPFFTTPNAASPVDGDAQISDTLDSSFVDTASVVSSYGVADDARVERRTAFVEERFLVVADTGTSATSRTWTWPLHGNAGGADGTWPGAPARSATNRRPGGAAALPPSPQVAAGGAFTQTATGATWTRPSGVALTAGLAFDVGGRAASAVDSYHEQGYKVLAQHTALRTSVAAPAVHGLQILYPTPAGRAAPTVTELSIPGAAALRLDDAGGDTRVVSVHRRSGAGRLVVPAALSGMPEISTDGDLLVVTSSASGAVRTVWAEGATEVVVGGVRTIRSDDRGDLGVSLAAGRVDVVADSADPVIDLEGLAFAPAAVDGACAVETGAGLVRVHRGGDARFTLRSSGGAGAPAADPGTTVAAAVGTSVTLDGTRSCDPDGAGLSYRWELVSAPAGTAWALAGATTARPTLTADRAGVYRVELVVTDAGGTPSDVAEVVVVAGPTQLDTLDGDLDGRFDAADPDLDTGDLRFVAVTPSRVLDSRRALGTTGGRWRAGESRDVPVRGWGTGVPDEAVAVVTTTTAVLPSAATHLTVHPAGETRPPTSSLNAAAGQTVANAVTSRIGAGGAVAVVNRAGDTDVVMDVTGYWVHDPSAGGFTPTGPTRILDSRSTGGAWAAGEVRTVAVAGGAGGVPDDAVAVVLTATAVAPTAGSHLTLWPTGRPRPTASSLNFPAGRTVAGSVMVAVGAGGTIDVRNQAGSVDVVLDVVGWYGPGGGELEPVAPARLLDTRAGLDPLGPSASRDLVVTGGPVPSGASAVVLNVTAVDPTAASHLTVWPAGTTRPTASSLNFPAGATVANQVVVGVGAGGAVSLGNRFGDVDVVVDVVGWYR